MNLQQIQEIQGQDKCCKRAEEVIGGQGICSTDCPFNQCPPGRETTQYKQKLTKRNSEIVQAKERGLQVKTLSRRFKLDERTIYRVIGGTNV